MRQLSVLVAFYVEIDSFREELRKRCSHSYLFKYEFNAEIQEFQILDSSRHNERESNLSFSHFITIFKWKIGCI